MKIYIKDSPQGHSHYQGRVKAEDIGLTSDDELEIVTLIDVDVDLTREGNSFYTLADTKTIVLMPCARCLERTEVAISGSFEGIFKWRPSSVPFTRISEEDDNHEFGGFELDLGELVRESVLMSLPIAPLCRPDCAGLCPHCGADLNRGKCSCHEESFDERWQALREIRDK